MAPAAASATAPATGSPDDADVDAVVIGSGPNGLVAALTLARAGWKVVVAEGASQAGGGTRTEELTLPGFHHDVCSSVHPLALASPALRDLDLAGAGVEWIHPDAPLAHGLRPDRAVLLERSLDVTAAGLGEDGHSWRRLLHPLVEAGTGLSDAVLAPRSLPRHPLAASRFALPGLRSATSLGRRFEGDEAPALLAGLAAHSVLPLDAPISGGYGLLLGQLAHLVGWPVARGGSRAVADALVRLLEEAGGEVRTGWWVRDLGELPPARAVLCDVAPRQLVELAGDRLPDRYRRALLRFRHGPGVFKVDWALSEPVPWADPGMGRAATVHLGGTLEDVRRAEHDVASGRHPEEPFVLVVQASRFDPTRAPEGAHTLWAYCHVPQGSTVDMTRQIEDRIETFAPGFRDVVLARHALGPADLEARNPNLVGGDIGGGASDLRQFLVRPVAAPRPWATPVPGLYLCSSSTPPGGGVHGMCGWSAARTVLRRGRSGR